jgi:O-antigen/teichoic acid export membrane protein
LGSVYIAIHYSDLVFGIVNTGTAVANYIGVIVAFGIPAILSRNIVQQPNHASIFVSTAIMVRVVIATITLAALSFVLSTAESSCLEKSVTFILSINACLSIFNLDQSFDALRRSSYLMYLCLVVAIILLLPEAPVTFILVSLVAANLLFSISNIVLFHYRVLKIRFILDLKIAKSLLLDSLPILTTTGLGVVYLNFAVTYLRKTEGLEAVADYGAASRIVLILIMLDVVVMRILVPKVAALALAPVSQHWSLLLHLLLIRASYAIPLVTFILFGYSWILELIYQGKYQQSGTLLQLLSLWFMGTMFTHFGTYLYTNGYTRQYVAWIAAKVAIFLMLTVWLTMKYAVEGAVYALIIAEYLAACWVLVILRYNIRQKSLAENTTLGEG